MIQYLQKRWVYHSMLWLFAYLGLMLVVFLEDAPELSFSQLITEPFLILIPVFLTTYLGFWAKKRFFDARRYFIYVMAVLAIVAIGVTIFELLLHMRGVQIGNSRTQNILNFVFIHFFSLGLQYFKRGVVNQYQLQELKAKTAITELNALKAQINPHFLFNTLNNIYGMNRIDSEKGSEMIMELSDVMRYHLEFSKVGQVKLEDEIQLLKSYVKLEQLRLSDTCDVQISFEQADESLMVSPLLFLPFVENAFKHGTHPTQDCFVHIELKTSSNQLWFSIKNSVITNRKVVKT
ncbi:MAG: histidine kinase, partial [Bacteroidota bacterium]